MSLLTSFKYSSRALALAAVLLGGPAWGRATPCADEAHLQAWQDLRISEAMAQRMGARLGEVRQSAKVTPEELADLERYRRRLEAAVREQRVEVARLEALRPPDPQCRRAANVISPSARRGVVTVPEMTEADELQALDAELNDSLSRFDEMLLKETDRLRRSAVSRPTDKDAEAWSGVDGPTAGVGGLTTAEPPEMAPKRGKAGEGTEERPTVDAQGLPPPPSGGAPRKGGTASARSVIPPDIPDGSDDDLVARQIREAAMNEPDPAVREKLWEEYRKYRQGAE